MGNKKGEVMKRAQLEEYIDAQRTNCSVARISCSLSGQDLSNLDCAGVYFDAHANFKGVKSLKGINLRDAHLTQVRNENANPEAFRRDNVDLRGTKSRPTCLDSFYLEQMAALGPLAPQPVTSQAASPTDPDRELARQITEMAKSGVRAFGHPRTGTGVEPKKGNIR